MKKLSKRFLNWVLLVKHRWQIRPFRLTRKERKYYRGMDRAYRKGNKESQQCQKASMPRKEYRKEFPIWPVWIVICIKRRVGSLICVLKGHSMIDESYGGPESGCMAGYCDRCNFSFHTQLY